MAAIAASADSADEFVGCKVNAEMSETRFHHPSLAHQDRGGVLFADGYVQRDCQLSPTLGAQNGLTIT